MGVLLVVHLGVVLALFLTLPYGKFVHGLYRTAALLKYRREAAGRAGLDKDPRHAAIDFLYRYHRQIRLAAAIAGAYLELNLRRNS